MKHSIIILLFISIASTAFSQAKKPTLMVVPSDTWCNLNGYVKEFTVGEHTEKYSDFDRALLENIDLTLAISKIGELMSERGFPLKDLNATLKSLKQQEVEESLSTSKSGDMLAETPLEKITKVAKADIIIELTWNINKTGPMKSLTYNLRALDAYTNKQVAASSGTGDQTSFGEIAVLLEEAVIMHIDQFNNQLQNHFNDLFAQGREVSLICKRWSAAEVDFESYIGPNEEELGIIIEDWMAENTVQGRFNTTDFSANRLTFEQVRIPLQNEKGRAIDTRRWASSLVRMLRTEYQIEAKLTTKGLGQAIITIGEK